MSDYKNVPLEPTEAMIEAVFGSSALTREAIKNIWATLIAAYPPSGNECIGEVRENGVVWFDQNPHAHPIGTRFYTSPRVVDGLLRESAEIITELCNAYGHPFPQATLDRIQAALGEGK